MNQAEHILLNEMDAGNTPSIQYYVFNKDSILYSFQSGFAGIKNNIRVNDKTTYNAFSITKTFTALAVLQLAERDMIDINKPVKKYLPEFPYSQSITVKQLMTHSAGIPNPFPLNWIHLAGEHSSFDRDGFFRNVFKEYDNAKSGPNEEFAYSNLGYVMLGMLVEKVSGTSFEQYIHENIFKKLGLRAEDIGFTITDPARHATGYIKRMSLMNFVLGFLIDKSKYMDKKEDKWMSFRNFYVNGVSYGGLISNPLALVKYIQELLKPGCVLLTDEYKQMLFTENFTNDGRGTGMCLSWFKGSLNGKRYFAHAGGGGGYYSEIRIYPDIGIGSVIMFNRTGMSDERFLDKTDKYFITN